VAFHVLGRSVLIGLGLAFMGERGSKLVKKSIAGAIAIEVFVLGWTAFHQPPPR
jgi:hypothetical protein